jgi:hypothetical protein
MKKNVGSIIAALTVGGFMAGVALADQEGIPIIFQGGTQPGVGSYTAMARWTNGAGATWIAPPTNTTSVTFADLSSYGSNYVSVATITPFIHPIMCSNSSSITISLTGVPKYEFTVYIKSPVPPPTNGQTLNLELNWQ